MYVSFNHNVNIQNCQQISTLGLVPKLYNGINVKSRLNFCTFRANFDTIKSAENDTILVTNKISSICIAASDISTGTRASQGVIVIKGNNVVKATRIN